MSVQASLNYTTNTGSRLDTREEVGSVQTEFTNSDVLAATYTDTFDRLVRPFAIAPGIRVPVGTYDFHTTQVSYTGGQQRKYSGALVYEFGPFYSGSRRSVALNAARLEITPRLSVEPGVSANWVDLAEGSFTATVVRARVTFTMTPRMFVSGITQYNSTGTSIGNDVRFRWEYQPGSELFVVYTDDYNTSALPGVDGLRNRALVIKMNRLFRP